MADKRKENNTNNMPNGEKKQTYVDYLQKGDVPMQIREGLLKLIENKPSEPMLFLANYFDSISSSDKFDKIANALQILNLTHHTQSVFQTNLMIAYDNVSVAKSNSSKKFTTKKSGLIGSVYEDLLTTVGSGLPKDVNDAILQLVGCRSNEMVPFDIFRYGITVFYVCIDFVKLCESLFQSLSGKQSSDIAQKYLCDAMVTALKETICESTSNLEEYDRPAAVLEMGYKLSPDKLAENMLCMKDSKDEKFMNQNDFVSEMCQVFFSTIKRF